MQCFLLFTRLQGLHRRFEHLSAEKLFNLLSRAEWSDMDSSIHQILLSIQRLRTPCQNYAQRPRLIRFTLRKYFDFNHLIYVDIFYIDNKPILYMLDEVIRLQAARWLLKPSLGSKPEGKLKHDPTEQSLRRAMRRC